MKKNPRFIRLALLNLVGFIGVVVINYLANALPINGNTTGDLSAFYPNLFVPAGFTFAIWGIIYLSLTIFTITSLGRALTGRSDWGVERIGIFFFLSCFVNMGWIFAWHYRFVPLSLLVMLGILGSLIMIYLRLGIGKKKVSVGEKLVVQLPFSLYLGWITIATVANVTTLLVDNGWTGGGISEATWAVIMIAAATAIGVAAVWTRRDFIFALVPIWAFWGIYSKRAAASPVYEDILTMTLIGMGIMALVGIAAGIRYARLSRA